jgi:hypothetical protein
MKNIVSIIFGLAAGAALLIGCTQPVSSPGPSSPATTLNLTFTSSTGSPYFAQGGGTFADNMTPFWQ